MSEPRTPEPIPTEEAVTRPEGTLRKAAPKFALLGETRSQRMFSDEGLLGVFLCLFTYYLCKYFVGHALLWMAAPFFSQWSGGVARLWGEMLEEGAGVAGALVPAFLMARLEGRRFDVYGLPRRQAFGKAFWTGGVWGLATLSLLLVGSAEEFSSRGYTQYTLARGTGFWPAAVLLSLRFGWIHVDNPGETWLGLLGVVAIGFFFCLTLYRTGNLWFAVGFHAFWDWGQTYLYSVPDSGTTEAGHLMRPSFQGPDWLTGGSAGPEGSVLCLVAIAAVSGVFAWRHREVRYGAGAGNENPHPSGA